MSDQASAASETTATTTTSGETPPPQVAEASALLLEGDAPAPEPEAEPFEVDKLVIPDGLDKADPLFGEFAEFAKAEKLSGKQAQKLTDLYGRAIAEAAQKQQAGWDKQNEEWLAVLKADKEFGGDKLMPAVNTFKRVASDPTGPFGPQFMSRVGVFGNDPDIIIPLLKVAKILSEGGPVQAHPSANGSRRPQSPGEAMYGPDGPHTGGPRLG